MIRREWIAKERTLTATTDDIRLERPHDLKELTLSIKGDVSDGTAMTGLDLLALIDPLELKVGGGVRMRLKGLDLYALNRFYLGHEPTLMDAGATTDEDARVVNMKIPCAIPAAEKLASYKIYRTAITGVDTETYTLSGDYVEGAMAEKPLRILTGDYTGVTTGVPTEVLETTLQGALEGILIWQTSTITNDDATPTIDEVEIYRGGDLVSRHTKFNLWSYLNTIKEVSGTATIEKLDNYYFIDLRREPMAAGKLLTLNMNFGTGEAIRVITIERLG